MQSAYIIFKVFSLRLKRNLRKPDVFKFTRFEAGICDERLPEVPRQWNSRSFFMPSYEFRARVGLTRSQGVANLLSTLCAPDVSFQREFLIYVKLRADLQSKKFHFSTIYPANFGINKKKIEHLELVPPSVSPFLVLPSIRRSNGSPKWPKP